MSEPVITCEGCGESKDASKFHPDLNGPHGRKTRCIDCVFREAGEEDHGVVEDQGAEVQTDDQGRPVHVGDRKEVFFPADWENTVKARMAGEDPED
jgi:hypothetical protein